MKNTTPLAHRRQDSQGVWHDHPLDSHLDATAQKAGEFANRFGQKAWGVLAGLWHDIGKYSKEFQRRIRGSGERVNHSTAGAQYAYKVLSWDKARLLAYVIAGHHAGLPDGTSSKESCLKKRLKKTVPDCSAYPGSGEGIEPGNVSLTPARIGFQLSFFTRMIYSCLVDADCLDTEMFMNEEKASWRNGYPALQELNEKLTIALKEKNKEDPSKPINRERASVLQSCLDAAELRQGLFSLTVPTGGGKTLSSLAFAFKHAIKYGLERVIYVIPYTSIIEQNAAVFRKILGPEAVLEHHSNFDPASKDTEEYRRAMLATENWDAPLIVTTNVQFFESLFHNRSSKCRKIHNIAKSVVILDEAQMLPVPFLRPCLEALRELSSDAYNTSVVLCTATQPALSTTETFPDGLDNVHEIITYPEDLYNRLDRVNVSNIRKIPDDELAEKLDKRKQVLCVVNTRKHARDLFEKLKIKEGCYHLSALMCPAHRTEKIETIKKALKNNLTCRVISTQLIEAGVDIDFPVVYRSIAGIDSIAQAAGRCNREGRPEKGEVYIFTPERGLPPGHIRLTAEAAETVLRQHDDPLALETVSAYFEELYWRKGEKLDEYKILKLLDEDAPRLNFPFKEVADKFTMIPNIMKPLIIPWNKDAEKLIQQVRNEKYPAKYIRRLQRFTIQIPDKVLRSLAVSVENIGEEKQFPVLRNMDIYRDDVGLCPEDPTFHKVESLIQ